MNILISLLVGAIAGWLAGMIRRGEGYGFLGNTIIGLLGGLIGGFAVGLLGIEDTNLIGNIIVSTLGAVILLFILNLGKSSNNKKL